MLEDLPRPSIAPGKSGARLWADLLHYLPQSKGPNILSQPPRQFRLDGPPHPTPKHTHELSQITNECSLSATNILDITKEYHVSAICEKCRFHFNIQVEFTKPKRFGELRICPAEDPLHHFRFEPSVSQPIDPSFIKKNPHIRWVDKRVFSCSGPTCPILLTIIIQAPILNQELTNLLVDSKLLEARMLQVQVEDPDTFDKGVDPVPITPYKALGTICTYIKNARGGDQRTISAQNLRFRTSLGKDCDVLMETAGFTYEEEEKNWRPPPLELVNDPNSKTMRDMEDMFKEVVIMMDEHKDNWAIPNVHMNITRADKEIKRLLGCERYDCTSNWHTDLTVPEHPHYAGLGAVGDFSDALIHWAYERQRACDPENAPYYFECLSGIALGRHSEMLNVEVAKARSEGAYTITDLSECYKSFDISPDTIDEEWIIGVFRSRLADSPRHEHQMRTNLKMIGHALKSQKIVNVSEKISILDANAAYDWLQVSPNTPDDFILSAYKVRVEDHAIDEATAKEALKMIADTRRSPILLTFLETGAIETPMDLGSAHARLGIDDRSIPDDLVIIVYNSRLQDAPKQFQDLRAALRTIANHRDSAKIKSFLETGQQSDQVQKGSENWPVGIENIGNTCYLNSLLQFYFTVKPLREMVLDIDKYQETDITDEVTERKRVGGRKVTKKEIERAKKFVGCLRTLFQNLITSGESSVSPERDLAYLTLVSSKDEAEEEVRRMSMSSADPPPLINVVDDTDKMDIDDQKPAVIPEPDDNASEATLVGEDPPPPYPGSNEEDYVMVHIDAKASRVKDKENCSPVKDTLPGFIGPLRAPPHNVAMNEVWDTDEKYSENMQKKGIKTQVPLTPPPEMPERPPPIPPRPKHEVPAKVDMMMFGRQQDVTECIGNVMFQLEAAIMPEKIDENGEQIDIVKNLFYGKTKQTLTFPNSSETRIKEELFSHLLVNVAEGDRDIYSALDSSFDIEKVDLEGREAKRYLSISHLPPILQIQVQRVQFDRAKSTAYKSNFHLQFEETIYLDRYIETNDPSLKERREESWQWKEELKILEKRKLALTKTQAGIELSEALDLAREWLSGLDHMEDDIEVDHSVLARLEARASAMRKELDVLETEIKDREFRITSQFTDLRRHGYRIHSVFIHRGSATFGHYWIYIYDYQNKIFRKYNDGYVTKVNDASEVFTHDDNSHPPTPYFLVFVREDQCLELMEAVKREIAH